MQSHCLCQCLNSARQQPTGVICESVALLGASLAAAGCVRLPLHSPKSALNGWMTGPPSHLQVGGHGHERLKARRKRVVQRLQLGARLACKQARQLGAPQVAVVAGWGHGGPMRE